MSRIPNSATPHAGPATTGTDEGAPTGAARAFSQLAGKVRDNPKTAIAAGAAVAAGVAAAAAIGVRSRSKSNGSGRRKKAG